MPLRRPVHFVLSSLLAILAGTVLAGDAAPPFERGLDAIRNELLCARSGLRALSVAAHPDDEDGGTLSYLRRTLGVETHLCLFTRGEGGQNESGPEYGPHLAALRTRETEEACAILGAQAWYLNLADFGYSKTGEETLKTWRRQLALERMVRTIRSVRPQVIFTNHDPQRADDHGHHLAAAQILFEAFEAAADPAKFPEQLTSPTNRGGLEPWSALKLYVRRFAAPGSTLAIDLSARDPLDGLSASETGAYALSRHASQGMLRQLKTGEREMRYFLLVESRLPNKEAAKAEKSLIDGLTPLTPEVSAAQIDKALQALSPAAAADGSLARLIAQALANQAGANESRAHLSRALCEALGLKMEATAGDAITTYGESVPITVRVANTGPLAVHVRSIELVPETADWSVQAPKLETNGLAPGISLEAVGTAKAGSGAPLSYPAVQHMALRDRTQSPLLARATFALADPASLPAGGVTFSLSCPVPLELAAPLEAAILPNPILLFDDPNHPDDLRRVITVRVAVTNRRRVQTPLVIKAGILRMPGDTPQDVKTVLARTEDETIALEFKTDATVKRLNKGDVSILAEVWTETPAGRDAGPTPAGGEKVVLSAPVRRVPLAMPQMIKVGLVQTYDASIFQALKAMEAGGLLLSVTQLSADDLRGMDLDYHFHTIILDQRATQYRPEVRPVRERLRAFMEGGGNVLCLYHKDFDWNLPDGQQSLRGKGIFRGNSGGGEIAPYPIELDFQRVTDENAEIRILHPQHPLLLTPCRIWPPDFQGWAQERGAYFPKKWAKEYTALLSSNDPGEGPLDGGLLAAEVGKGSFIYCGYFLHRQLRAGVPGAYRLLSNLLYYPRTKKKP